MRATITAPPTHTVEIINDFFECRKELDTPVQRGDLIESLLWLIKQQVDRELSDQAEPEPALCCCFHVYRDRIAVHFFGAPGREEEALAELRGGGVDV